ncbi:MAG: CHAT domain-containing protein, partial [Acidobacteria bacterium]|nr:CHAT domain-containing protein [Acidobacteriota bacterium]
KDSKPGALALTLFGLGELRRYRGNLVEARKLFEEALPLAREGKERGCEADVLSSLAMLDLKEGKLDVSRKRIEEALPIREELKDLRGEGSTRLKLGFLLERLGELSGAVVEMRRAVELFEAAKYQGGEAFGRQALAILARRSGDLGEANVQMLRAVGIAEGLRQRLSDRDLRATYIGYVQNRYEFLIETLLEQDRGNARRAFEMSERARARALLEELRDAGVKNATDAAPSLNLEQIQRARKAYEAYRQAGPLPDANGLKKLLIGTVKAKRLVVVADGALQYLPFADLCPEATVVIAPSASAIGVLRGLPKRPVPQRKIAVFADPDAPQLSRLPFARMEAESILGLVAEPKRSLAMGPMATRKAVLASQAEILHFAAHSTLDTERPEKTEIVLSGGSLRLRDIYSMKVDATLVVLSACQTALGKSMKREGLIGLTRAFQEAGVERVVASLWKVDDRATAELMKRFYEAMLRGGKTAADALRQAQQSLAGTKRWSHPFYWAGFVLEGEWR